MLFSPKIGHRDFYHVNNSTLSTVTNYARVRGTIGNETKNLLGNINRVHLLSI